MLYTVQLKPRSVCYNTNPGTLACTVWKCKYNMLNFRSKFVTFYQIKKLASFKNAVLEWSIIVSSERAIITVLLNSKTIYLQVIDSAQVYKDILAEKSTVTYIMRLQKDQGTI